MELPFENTLYFGPPPTENKDAISAGTTDDLPHSELFENMTVLLLHMEAELQFKETVIEILLRNHTAQEKLREELKNLKVDEFTDPLNGLARDSIFDQKTWEDSFEGFPGFKPIEDPEFYRERPCYLAVVNGVRAMKVAQTQYERYKNQNITLEKLQRQHQKLKAKYSSATKLNDFEIAFTGDTLLYLQQERRMLKDTLEWERKQNQNLNSQLQMLEKKLESQKKRSTKVINLLLLEIERLTRTLIQFENREVNNVALEDEEEDECEELFSDEESTYFNSPNNSRDSQLSNNYNTIKSMRKSRNYSERRQENDERPVEHRSQQLNQKYHTELSTNGKENDIRTTTDNSNKIKFCPETFSGYHHTEPEHKSHQEESLQTNFHSFGIPYMGRHSNGIEPLETKDKSGIVTRNRYNESTASPYWDESNDDSSNEPEGGDEVIIQATLTGSCVSSTS